MSGGRSGNSALMAGLVGIFLVLGGGGESASLLGQTSSVSGRVVATGSAEGLPGITVELAGHGRTATDRDGSFRLGGVPDGGYTLNVVGFGYAPRSQYVFVEEDPVLVVSLRPSPVALAVRTVGAPSAPVTGTVREAGMGRPSEGSVYGPPRDLPGAVILSNQGHIVRAGRSGDFRIDGAIPGVPLAVTVRAFGYRPLEVVITPGSTEVALELEPDPQIRSMIEAEVVRLRQRTVGHADLVPPLEREALLVHAAADVAELIDTDLRAFRGRIQCVVVDDRPVFDPGPLLRSTPLDELERIEVLAHPADPELAMLRVYTRAFIRDMVGGSLRLASPQFLAVTRAGSTEGPPACK